MSHCPLRYAIGRRITAAELASALSSRSTISQQVTTSISVTAERNWCDFALALAARKNRGCGCPTAARPAGFDGQQRIIGKHRAGRIAPAA